MKKILLLGTFVATTVAAQGQSGLELGGFVDTYYAYDFNDPTSMDREFTTQPSRHNEFNINLAYIEAVLKEKDRRGRLALQYGTSVDKNYISEPSKNIQVIQESYVGFKLNEKLWMDAGIFLGHIGAESWISKYNINYSRSLILDYVPYYASGVKFEYQNNQNESFHLHILNGWQNIQENNSGKAICLRYLRSLSLDSTFIYNNFFGDEKVTIPKSRFRSYHNFIYEHKLNDIWKLQGSVDVGSQSQLENNGVNTWYGTSLILGQTLDQLQAIGYRIEYYLDRDESNIVTSTPNGFEVMSASVNYDRSLVKDTLWRTELRGFYSKDQIYPQGAGHRNHWDGFLVTSLSLSI